MRFTSIIAPIVCACVLPIVITVCGQVHLHPAGSFVPIGWISFADFTNFVAGDGILQRSSGADLSEIIGNIKSDNRDDF